jgi:CubicO group peptidase (beta-lactamase class C family)
MLVEDGKINLDDKIGKYLGDVPESWKDITIRHLLSHTSGMTDYPRDFDFRRGYTEDEIFKRAKEIPVAFKPARNGSTAILDTSRSASDQQGEGKFYGEFLQERIFQPLGMDDRSNY